MPEGQEGYNPDNQKDTLPGKAFRARPLEVNGEFYDPIHPPRLVRNQDGSESYVGGRKVDRDDVYAERYWEREKTKGDDQFLDERKKAMVEGIHKFANEGRMPILLGGGNLDEQDKEKLSAYRKLAKELGYQVGNFTHNQDTHVAIAPITKPNK